MMEELRKDCQFFQRLHIIDYSLLIGIHDRQRNDPASYPKSRSRLDYKHLDDHQDNPDKIGNIFTGGFDCEGEGILSSDQRFIYFFGIIDILTVYKYG